MLNKHSVWLRRIINSNLRPSHLSHSEQQQAGGPQTLSSTAAEADPWLHSRYIVLFIMRSQNIVLKRAPAYRVMDPAHSMPNVVFVLSLEDEPPIGVILLGWSVQLSIHICALENTSILIGVYTLALQGVIHVVSLQGTGRQGRTETVRLHSTTALSLSHTCGG